MSSIAVVRLNTVPARDEPIEVSAGVSAGVLLVEGAPVNVLSMAGPESVRPVPRNSRISLAIALTDCCRAKTTSASGFVLRLLRAPDGYKVST